MKSNFFFYRVLPYLPKILFHINRLFLLLGLFGNIKKVKDEIVTSSGFSNATPQRNVLFIDRVTGQSKDFEAVITKLRYDQSINSRTIKTCLMQSTIKTRVLKVGDFLIIKEEYILYKGNPFEHLFIFLSIDITSSQGQVFLNKNILQEKYSG